jgi:hypothetical protein
VQRNGAQVARVKVLMHLEQITLVTDRGAQRLMQRR